MQNPTTPTPVTVEVTSLQATRPLTQTEIGVIRQQRSEISEQLTSTQRRRDNLLDDIRTAPAGTEAGLMQQLQVLNDRIVSIERDMEQAGRTLRTGQVPVGTTIVPSGAAFDEIAAERAAGIAASVIVPVLLGMFVLRWLRRRRGRGRDARNTAEQDARMERLEQAVDAIALEVERVGESQRFQGRILTEANLMPALGGAHRVAEPIRMAEFEEVRRGQGG